MIRYRKLIGCHGSSGIGVYRFAVVWDSVIYGIAGITFHGSGAGQFLYVIAGLHALHVLGGVIALFVLVVQGMVIRESGVIMRCLLK